MAPPSLLRDRRGALHLPLLIVLLLTSLAGFGFWGMMRHWRQLTELQLRLDRCVGSRALDLKRTLTRIEVANAKIQALRASILLAPDPAIKASLRTALALTVGYQDTELAGWRAKTLAWLARQGCGERRDLPAPLPEMPWLRPPPDALGPKELRWPESVPRVLRVQVHHRPRGAAAKVFYESSHWQASWAPPGPGVGPSYD